MNRIESIILPSLSFEVVFGCKGYQVELRQPVEAECFMNPTPSSNKPARVTLPSGAVMQSVGMRKGGKGIQLSLPDNYDVTDEVDMELVTQLVREARAEQEELELEGLAARHGIELHHW